MFDNESLCDTIGPVGELYPWLFCHGYHNTFLQYTQVEEDFEIAITLWTDKT